MDDVNLDPVANRPVPSVVPDVPIADLRTMRLHKILAFREGHEWSEQSVRALDVGLNSGTRFEDLPQDLRDLARLLFVKNGPIYVVELGHFMKCRNCPKTYDGLSDNLKNMINEIYFPENLFHFDNQSRLHSLLSNRKESRNMRRVGVDLKNLDNAVPSLRTFARDLGLLQQLRELEIGVNEAQMVQAMCQADPGYSAVLMRPQDIPGTMNKLVLRMRGLKHLQRTLVPKVSFTGWIHKDNPEPYYSRCTGPIPGGVLETIVASSMMRQSKAAPARRETQKRKAPASAADYQPGRAILSEGPALKQPRRSARIQEKSTGTPDETLLTLPTPPTKRVRKPLASFNFCNLPAELRNRIYYWIFYNDGPIHPSKNAPTSCYRDRHQLQPSQWPQSSLALVLVCKQLFEEALGLYYSQNRFVFYYPLQATMFIQTISARRTSFIKDMELWYKPSYNQGGINLFEVTVIQISQLSNLENLTLVLDGHTASKNDATRRSFTGVVELPGEKGLRALSQKGVKVSVTCPEAETSLFHRLDDSGNTTPWVLLGPAVKFTHDVASAQHMRNGAEAVQLRINGSE